MTQMIPTIGRKVWYWGDQGERTYGVDQAMDATVIYVWGPNCVNLKVVDHAGFDYIRTSVLLREPAPGDCRNGEYYCTWMPYQVGQARAAPAT